MSKKYVLGTGLSSLIFCWYNKDYVAIGPSEGLGGKLSNDFMKNTIYLHESLEAIEFLNEVSIPFTKKTHTIKYCKGGVIQREIYQIDKLAFIKKKMNDKDFIVTDTTLSTHDYYQSVLQFDWQDLIKKLSEKVEIINETVIRINDKEIITDKTSYEYEEIVSTLPATTFWTLYYQTKHLDFRSVPVTFVLSDEVPNVLSGVPFDLMYFIDNKYRYTRINAQNDKYLYEFSGKLTEEEIKKCLPKSAEILKYYVDEMGIIISNVNNIPPPRIRFISRFSMWNHKIKLNDVIKESKFSYSFNNIWNTQASFSKNFMDFNKLNNDEYVEQQTRDYLLHVMGEIAEVLEHTNYKKHKQKKELDRSGVKEELIDIQKYLLNLFLLYNVDVREFVELFNSKSKIVEERWKKENEQKI